MGWGWEVWCNPEVDRRPRGKRWRDRRRRRETHPERQGNGYGAHPCPTSPIDLIFSPSGRHCPAWGWEAGGGHRAWGPAPRTLPPVAASWRAVHDAGGSGAAHRTGGGGRKPQEVSTQQETSYPLTQEMPPPCPATCPPVCIELSGWGLKAPSSSFHWTQGLWKMSHQRFPMYGQEGPRERD